MLFIGGVCIASGVFFIMLTVWGGTKESMASDFAPPEPEPVDPPGQPGHQAWWKALELYDKAEAKITDFLEQRKKKGKEKKGKWEPIVDEYMPTSDPTDPNKKLFELPPKSSSKSSKSSSSSDN